MNRRGFACGAALLFALMGNASLLGVGDGDGDGIFRLRLLHTNDMHARFEQVSKKAERCSEEEAARELCYGGFARVSTALQEEMARAAEERVPVLSLNAGDSFQGTVWYSSFKWKVVAHFVNMLKIDAMALGNHEFDDGIAGLVPFLQNVTVPILACNLDSTDEPEMDRSPIRHRIVLEKEGRKIGIVGYLTPETAVLADTGKVKFADEIERLSEEAKKLTEEGVDVIIALGHSGLDVDLKIAELVPGLDVVVGGHSHTFLYTGEPPEDDHVGGEYPIVVTQTGGENVAVVQAYAFTKYLGKLDLEFDERGRLKRAWGNPILLDRHVREDPKVLREVVSWKEKLQTSLKERLAKTNVLLDGSVCRFRECNLGNLITDSYIDHVVKSYDGAFWTYAGIAVQQAGGIRVSIDATEKKGVVTLEDLLTSMPFESPLSVISIPGKHLLEAFEWSVARYDPNSKWGRGEFLQVSGAKVEYDVLAPPGSRVSSLRLRCTDCRVPDYRELEPDLPYGVIMPTFLFLGGDNFTMFKKYGKEIRRLGATDTNATAEYLRDRGIVYNGLEGRIQVLSTSAATSFISKSSYVFLYMVLSTVILK